MPSLKYESRAELVGCPPTPRSSAPSALPEGEQEWKREAGGWRIGAGGLLSSPLCCLSLCPPMGKRSHWGVGHEGPGNFFPQGQLWLLVALFPADLKACVYICKSNNLDPDHMGL